MSKKKLKVIFAVGTRPNFMKVAPLIIEVSKHADKFTWLLVHTGQHYSEDMSKILFDDLSLPRPDVYLGVGSGSHAEQTGKVMIEFEKVCFETKSFAYKKPDLIVVFGDVNSTLACALVGAKLDIPVVHVEAGLRSFDRAMPEEINRIVTDHVSDYLFTTCEDANDNLRNEGIAKEKIHFVGNTMIDSLMNHITRSEDSLILDKLSLRNNGHVKRYGVVTLHRPSNVDNEETLKGIMGALEEIAREIPLIFPVHPRTAWRIKDFEPAGVMITPPLGYLDFLSLMANARIVLTDSGGIQEETTFLGVDCLTLRDNTERPITIKDGTNILVGNDPERIIKTASDILRTGSPKLKSPKYWDGKAAERIIEVLSNE